MPELRFRGCTFVPEVTIGLGGVLLPPPPQAAAKAKPQTIESPPSARRIELLFDCISRHPLWQHVRHVSLPEKWTHVAPGIEDESRLLDHKRPASAPAIFSGRDELWEVGAKELLEVRRGCALPSHAEDLSLGRDIFPECARRNC